MADHLLINYPRLYLSISLPGCSLASQVTMQQSEGHPYAEEIEEDSFSVSAVLLYIIFCSCPASLAFVTSNRFSHTLLSVLHASSLRSLPSFLSLHLPVSFITPTTVSTVCLPPLTSSSPFTPSPPLDHLYMRSPFPKIFHLFLPPRRLPPSPVDPLHPISFLPPRLILPLHPAHCGRRLYMHSSRISRKHLSHPTHSPLPISSSSTHASHTNFMFTHPLDIFLLSNTFFSRLRSSNSVSRDRVATSQRLSRLSFPHAPSSFFSVPDF